MIKTLLARLVLAGLCPLIWFVRAGRGDGRKHSRRFRFCAEFLSLVPFELGILARRLYYERTLARCGQDLMVFFGATFLNPGATVGDRLEVRPYAMIGLADIGDDVSLAQRVPQHGDLDGPHLVAPYRFKPVFTGKRLAGLIGATVPVEANDDRRLVHPLLPPSPVG